MTTSSIPFRTARHAGARPSIVETLRATLRQLFLARATRTFFMTIAVGMMALAGFALITAFVIGLLDVTGIWEPWRGLLTFAISVPLLGLLGLCVYRFAQKARARIYR